MKLLHSVNALDIHVGVNANAEKHQCLQEYDNIQPITCIAGFMQLECFTHAKESTRGFILGKKKIAYTVQSICA